MTKKNGTKRSLLMSAVALVLCFSMLVGSTFAWFTDSVTSSGNIIASGKLDVEMMWANGTADPDGGSTSWNNAATSTIFNYDLWEPGYVDAKHIMIKNEGNLALKYQLNIVADGDPSDLTDVIDVYYFDGAEQITDRTQLTADHYLGTLTQALAAMSTTASGNLEATEAHTITLALKMQESAGNEYMDKSIGSSFAVQLVATQLASEVDSFNNQYDVDAKYPVVSVPTTINPATPAADITLTTTENTDTPVTITVPAEVVQALPADVTSISLAHSEPEVDTTNNIVTFDSIELVDQDGKIVELSELSATEDLEIILPLENAFDAGETVFVYHDGEQVATAVVATDGTITYEVAHLCEVEVVNATHKFAGGTGDEDTPYLIETAEQLSTISDMYDGNYTYFKVADGVETLDMTGVGKIYLNGSFDGNGVKIVNLTTALFERVGKYNEAKEIKISNMDVTVNTTDGRALVRNIYNPGTTTFENVAMHGYIEGQYNMGSFYNYGTANHGSSEGADYTVSFVNATSDVTLVCTTGNAIGGMLGHGYEGANYKLSINMDANSGYTGEMYTTGTATCYQVMAMCSHATYMLNGVETSRYTNEYPSTRLTAVKPEAKNDGYYVTPAAGVDHYVVFVNAQMTAYDENNVQIPNLSGMTWPLGKVTITEGFNGKVFDKIESATIVNGVDHKLGYAMDGGALTIYSGKSENYASGWVTLQVNQYDAENNLLATGNLEVYRFAEPTT